MAKFFLFRLVTVFVTLVMLRGCSEQIAVTSTSVITKGQGQVFALLADNRLLKVNIQDAVIVGNIALAPEPPDVTKRSLGHILVESNDHKYLFILVPGWDSEATTLVAIETATARVKFNKKLAQSDVSYRSLALGATTGKLYLFGNQAGKVVVTVLNSADGTEVANWVALDAPDRDWSVYQGEVSADEHQIYISYHGSNTTGIDRFEVTPNGLVRCKQRLLPNLGCISAHGAFVLTQNRLFTATGGTLIDEVDTTNDVTKQSWDTRLENNHLMEFALDLPAQRLYAIGSCHYSGGFSSLDFKSKGILATPQALGEKNWIVTPAPPNLFIAPVPNLASAVPCGERLVVAPNDLLVIAQGYALPEPRLPGMLLFINANNGQILRSTATRSGIMDLIVITDP